MKVKVTTPDGQSFIVNAPDDATHDQIYEFVASQHPAPQAKPELDEPGFLVGVGKGINDVARGVTGLFGKPTGFVEPDPQADAVINQQAPIGTIAGNMLATAPAMLIPGVNTLKGASLMGAGLGYATNEKDRSQHMLEGALGGAVGNMLPHVFNVASKALAPLGSVDTKERVIGRALNRVTDPNSDDVIARLESAQGLIPGSFPTAAEVAKSGGMAAMQRAVASAYPEQFAQRISDNAAARRAALQEIAGDEAKMQAAQEARNLGTSNDYLIVHDQIIPETPELKKILQTQAGQQAIEAAKKIASNEYRKFGDAVSAPMTSKEMTDFENSLNQANNVQFQNEQNAIKQPAVHWTQQGIKENDNLLTAIRKLGGINKEMAQQTYGNRIWEELPSGLFRNQGGHSLDDLITLLADHGYISETAMPKDLVETLYFGHPENIFSLKKTNFNDIYAPDRTEQDVAHDQLDRLIAALEKQNQLKTTPKKQTKIDNIEEEEETPKFYHGKDLHTIQRAMGAMAADRNIDPVLRHSIGNVFSDYKSLLEREIPGLLDVNQKYAELSKPINQMQVGQELLNKLGDSLSNYTMNSTEMKNRYATALNDVRGNLVKQATGGIKRDLEDVMTPDQMNTLKNIAVELGRKQNAENEGRGVASNTYQHLSMDGLLQAAGVPTWASGLLNFAPFTPIKTGLKMVGNAAYGDAEKTMKGLLADALLDPKETARIMRKGQEKTLADKLGQDKYRTLGGLLGTSMTSY